MDNLKKWFNAIENLSRLMYLLSKTKNKRIQNKLLKKIEKLNVEIFVNS